MTTDPKDAEIARLNQQWDEHDAAWCERVAVLTDALHKAEAALAEANRAAIAKIAEATEARMRAEAERDAALALVAGAETFQGRVQPWMQACFGPEISADRLERGDRLLEEVFELLQSGGYPRERVASLTGYVWSRPAGEPAQEVGGVMVTLAAYCLAHGLDMHSAGETELARIWTKVEAIRAKQAAKPKGSALPQEWSTPAPVASAEGLDADFDQAFQLIYEAYSCPADRFATDASYSEFLRGKVTKAFSLMQTLRSAPPVGARVTGWQPIETAPHEELVVLGWQEDGTWKQEIALASAGERFPNGYSNRWQHGRATHWMPLPEPPAALLPAGEGE